MMSNKDHITSGKPLTNNEKLKGIKRLRTLLEEVTLYIPRNAPEGKMAYLARRIENTLGDIFGYGTPKYKSYSDASNLYPGPIYFNIGESPYNNLDISILDYGKNNAISLIEAAIADLKENLDDEEIKNAGNFNSKYDHEKIFIVHGHDEQTKITVENFIRTLGLIPIILSDRVNAGRHILQKFTEETDQIGFAIILMTADDLGGKSEKELKPRARQNVIIELGYFICKLGPGRVAVILSDNAIEIPSDIHGVAYTSFTLSDSTWKIGLLRELQHAGYPVDANKML